MFEKTAKSAPSSGVHRLHAAPFWGFDSPYIVSYKVHGKGATGPSSGLECLVFPAAVGYQCRVESE